MSKLIPALVATVVVAMMCSACPAPAPPRDIASADRCDDIPDDAELGALYSNTISRVDAIESPSIAGTEERRLEGASIRLRRVSVDDAVMARALACHAARADVPSVSRRAPKIDPLRPPGGEVRVAVERSGGDVVVRVTSRDAMVAADVLQRSVMLSDRSKERARRIASEK